MSRKMTMLTAICAVAALLTTALVSRSMFAAGTGYFVSPGGNDSASGVAANAAFKTIQKAVDLAQPGDTITLASGTYMQDVVTRRNGTDSAPITIKGPADAVVKGGGAARIFEVNHDNLTLSGFTIDGLYGSSGSASGYRDKLLYVLGKQPRDGVSGLRVLGMTIKNAGGECVRLRYFARQNEIGSSWIGPCGVHDFRFGAGGKNGEGIYIGTAPEQRGDGKNPTSDPDLSNGNRIHDNVINTQGNECVDVKEAASGNVVEGNNCTGQKDPESGGLDSRGNGNIFRNNMVYANLGAGVRLGGDTAADGVGNLVYGNTITDNRSGGIKFQRTPQATICGNSMANNSGGNSVGSYASEFNPVSACSGGSGGGGSVPTATPAPTAPPTATPAPATATPVPSAPATATPAPVPPVGGALPVIGVSAGSDDGNVAGNTVDNNLSTRWSAQGDSQWIAYDFGKSVSVGSIMIAFHRGNERISSFDIDVSTDALGWQRILSARSSGTTLQPETFDLPDTVARYVRFVGHGNTGNDWNSLTEVAIIGASPTGTGDATPTPSPTAAPAEATATPTAAPAEATATPTAAPAEATATPAPTQAPTATPAPTQAPTATPQPTTAPPAASCGGYSVNNDAPTFIEAEAFSGAGGRFGAAGDGGRSGGAYMTIAGNGMHEDVGTFVSYTLNVDGDDSYYIWLLGSGANGSSDSFYVQIDGGPLVEAVVPTGGWAWHEVSDELDIGSGAHTLRIVNREDGASVDKIALTADGDYEPRGLGDVAACR